MALPNRKKYIFFVCKKQKDSVLDREIDSQHKGDDLESIYLDKEDVRRLHVLLHGLGEPYKEVG